MPTPQEAPIQFADDLEEFAYATSHDLKAPLRAINNLSQWIEEDLAGGEAPQLHEHLTLLKQRVERMNRLLDGLLDYSRACTRPGPVLEVDLNELVQELVKSLPEKPGIRVLVNAKLPSFQASGNALALALRQMISNALKHHDKASGEIRVSAEDLGDKVEIKVKDDGPGIDPKDHEKIFKVCQTLKSKEELEASGMGLAVLKKIAEKRGGSIGLESAPGMGSTFSLLWPKGA